MKISQQSRNLLVTVLLGGGAIGYVFLVFLPMQTKTVVLRDELKSQRDFVEQSLTLASSMTNVENELHTARAFAAAWRNAAPHTDQLAPAFGAITRCAAEAGVEVLHFDPQPTAAMETIARAPLALSCSGSFQQICRYLELLEAQPQTIWIEDMLLSGSNAAGEKMTCELSLVVFADNREVSH
jgi:Tfp pilus assembly protein PilO